MESHEMIDQYNIRGEKLGVIDKADAHKLGLLHKSIHVWLINKKNEILLQYRCKDKLLYPNTWDCSFAGHVGAGETSIEAVVREGKEEIGIDVDLEKLEYLMTLKENIKYKNINSNEYVDIFLLRQDFDIKKVKFQMEEVSDAKYFSKKEFFELIKSDKVLPHKLEYIILEELLKD